MPFARRRRRQGRGGSRRQKEWWGGVLVPEGNDLNEAKPVYLAPDSSLTSWIIHPLDALEFFDEPTLVRSLIHWAVNVPDADITGAADPPWYSAVAMGIVECNTQDPDGIDPALPYAWNLNADWIWWDCCILGTNDLGAVVPLAFMNQANDDIRNLDIRAKRKIRGGYGIGISMSTSTDATQGVQIVFHSRHLFLN